MAKDSWCAGCGTAPFGAVPFSFFYAGLLAFRISSESFCIILLQNVSAL